MELLFESRTGLDRMSGLLRFVQHQPRFPDRPVLLPDGPGDALGVSIYGSVHQVDGRYRMWYYAVPPSGDAVKDGFHVAYAESEDGETWAKPALSLDPHHPPGANLTNLGLHSATVFIDPDGPVEKRYRAVGCGRPVPGCNPGVTVGGYHTASSPDGLRWTLDAPTPRWHAIDVVTTAWHPCRRQATVALKRTLTVGGIARRSIHTAPYADGVYGDDVSALYPDDYDDLLARHRGFHSADYYGMGMMPAGRDGMVGFLWMYWHQLPYSKGWGRGPQALYGQSDITLVYQMETGGRWLHMPGRPLFIDSQRLPMPAGWINSASNVVQVGDEQRLYFTYRLHPHGYGLDVDWKRQAEVNPLAGSCISYAAWPANRLFGFQASGQATLRIKLGQVGQPSRLHLNAIAQRPSGVIRAELADGNQSLRDVESAIPLTGDHLATPLAWREGDIIPPGQDVMVTLHLNDATVYAYELRPV